MVLQRICSSDSVIARYLSSPARSRRGGDPCQVQRGGVPHLRYLPPSDLAGGGGTPPWGTPPSWTWPGGYPTMVPPSSCQTWLGDTPARSSWGVPHLGTPPPWSDLAWGGTPTRWGTPSRVVLDAPRSVCLVRSRRRTFLLELF